MFTPRTVDQIRSDLESRLDDKIVNLNNFIQGSFNYDFLTAYAEDIHEYEIRLKAAQLSGQPRYAGKTLTQQDLENLNIGYLDPSEINPYMDDQHLDELARLVDVERFSGSRATGTLRLETIDDTVEIEEGTPFSTDPTSGEQLNFLIDADGDGVIDEESPATVSPDQGETTVEVDAIAEDVGIDYNVPAGTVTYMPSPPPGVESVTNPNAFLGGQNVQSTEELREQVLNSFTRRSGGGTVAGIEGAVIADTDATSAFIDEETSANPPIVDVVVEGGSASEIQSVLDDARPVGIDPTLVRPDQIEIGADTLLQGGLIDTLDVEDAIVSFIHDSDIGDELRRDQLQARIIRADDSINDIATLNTRVEGVTNENIRYESGTDIYRLTAVPLGRVRREEQYYLSGKTTYPLSVGGVDESSVRVEATVNGITQTLTRGSDADYELIDDDEDGDSDAIWFTGSGRVPDDETVFYVNYDHDRYGVTEVSDRSGNTYTVGTDVAVVDDDGDGRPDSLDWSINGSTPAEGEFFSVDYDTHTSFLQDFPTGVRETLTSDSSYVSVSRI